VIEIHTEDLEEHFNDAAGEALLHNILHNTKRYQTLFQDAVDVLMPGKTEDIEESEMEAYDDLLLNQRLLNLAQLPTNNDPAQNDQI